MGMPTQPVLDVMRRTMVNLEFVEARSSRNGPYEVTQLINSFLGALAHPLEEFSEELKSLPVSEAVNRGWPAIGKEWPTDREPRSMDELIRLLRNAVAHGNVEFLPDGRGEINALRLWNIDSRSKQRTWGAIVTVDNTRKLLTLFVDLIEERHRDYGWYMPRSA
jgi:hypothetical protein